MLTLPTDTVRPASPAGPQRYPDEVTPAEVQILAFVHGARDLTRRRLDR